MTKTIFRKWRKSGDVIALFPEIPADANGHYCLSYEHVGQHGAANPAIIHDTKAATPEEYAELKKELEAIGYEIQVVQRYRREFGETRIREARHELA